ncbi:4-hydroxyphenylpyruvate dioxygenase-like protein [Rhinophrynus dorsalis]
MISPLIRLSHISLQVSNSAKVIRDLVSKYRFCPFAARGLDGGSPYQVALRNGEVIFIVNQKSTDSSALLYDSPLPHLSPDTANNISFEVEDVPGLCQRLTGEGCQLLVPPVELHDDFGSVTYCVVKSVVGNVSHTLIDRTHYGTNFLPGFKSLESRIDDHSPGYITHVDHITYACPRGSTSKILEWYQRCFGFQHFPLYKGENPERGYEITGPRIGLRLTSMECPRLIEGGKLVVVESMPQEGINQIDQFLKHHKGGGIQHVGLSTSDIFKTALELSQTGVCFASQPPSYYSDPKKQEEICRLGLEPQMLSQFGILVDSAPGDTGAHDAPRRFLMQVFAEPLFLKDSFFLELIERRAAEGFGEGNIRALWRSVQDFQEDLNEKEKEGVVAPAIAK